MQPRAQQRPGRGEASASHAVACSARCARRHHFVHSAQVCFGASVTSCNLAGGLTKKARCNTLPSPLARACTWENVPGLAGQNIVLRPKPPQRVGSNTANAWWGLTIAQRRDTLRRRRRPPRVRLAALSARAATVTRCGQHRVQWRGDSHAAQLKPTMRRESYSALESAKRTHPVEAQTAQPPRAAARERHSRDSQNAIGIGAAASRDTTSFCRQSARDAVVTRANEARCRRSSCHLAAAALKAMTTKKEQTIARYSAPWRTSSSLFGASVDSRACLADSTDIKSASGSAGEIPANAACQDFACHWWESGAIDTHHPASSSMPGSGSILLHHEVRST